MNTTRARTASVSLTALLMAVLLTACAGKKSEVAQVPDQPVGVTVEEAQEKLQRSRPDLPIAQIVDAPIPGFFEVQLEGGMRLYMTSTAEHLFAGDLYEVAESGLVNVTESSRTNNRKDLLDELDESQMLVFAPAEDKIKATITVFTDIDCGFCRKLHAEVPELNRMGVSVRYLGYPRAGVGSPSYDKLVSAWCADNAHLAMTKAKLGQEIEPSNCENPIASHLVLGEQFGVTGTPAIIFEDGRLQAGYAPAPEMAKRLGLN